MLLSHSSSSPSSTRRPFLRLSLFGTFLLLFAFPWYTYTGCGGGTETYSGFSFFFAYLRYDVSAWLTHWETILAVNGGLGLMAAGALAPIYARFSLQWASPARRFFVSLIAALFTLGGSGYFAFWMSIGLLDPPNAHAALYAAAAALVATWVLAVVTAVLSAVEWRRAVVVARAPRLRSRATGTTVVE